MEARFSLSRTERDVQYTAEIDRSLELLTLSAESAVGSLATATSASASIGCGLTEVEVLIAAAQREVCNQRATRNSLKAQLRNRQALIVAEETHRIAELERTTTFLREEGTKLDGDLQVIDAEIAALTQQLSSVRISLEDVDDNVDAAATETEHAVLRKDSLFHAVSRLPEQEAVEAFLERMAFGIVPSSLRDVRTLAHKTIPTL